MLTRMLDSPSPEEEMDQQWGAAELERLERIYTDAQIVEQRAQTRRALAVRLGGVDIGCGPGFLLAELAR